MRQLIAALIALVLAFPADARPRRFVLIVIDQLRADVPGRFGMARVLSLARDGASFPDAHVGHLASETVVSHPVMTSGRLPRSLPWGDEVLRDTRGTLGPAGDLWLATGLSLGEMRRLFAATPGPAGLPERLRAALGGSVWAIGAKSYATFGMGMPGADHVITMSGPGADGRRGPEGDGLPAWLTGSNGARFRVDGKRTYGTEKLEYPLKGDQYTAGPDPAREGGDLWVADLAVEVMSREPDWRALLLTMGGVDKVGHLLGEYHGPVDEGQDARVHLAGAAREADAAVGRVLDELARRRLDRETLVLLTADHGAQTGRLVGDRGAGRANENWYTGRTDNARYTRPSRVIAPVASHPAVGFVMADTALRVWLEPGAQRDARALVDVARRLRALPGVLEVHALRGARYARLHRNAAPADSVERTATGARVAAGWYPRMTAPLMATLAAPHAPDLVALLEDGITYGTRGDHGGHQWPVQAIPFYVRGPGVARGPRPDAARLVDITPTVLRAMGLPVGDGYDGRALDLAP